jgi:hypothetical protein
VEAGKTPLARSQKAPRATRAGRDPGPREATAPSSAITRPAPSGTPRPENRMAVGYDGFVEAACRIRDIVTLLAQQTGSTTRPSRPPDKATHGDGQNR